MRERFPKTRFILKILPLLLSILICFVGCEKESIYELETENSTEKINREVSIKEITFQEIEDHSLLNEVKSNLKRNKISYADKNSIKDIYDFEIDSNQIKEIKRGDKTSYTILIHRNSSFFEGFENLVVYRDKEDLPQAFLMQYPDASKVEMIDGHNSFYYHGEPTLIPLLDIKKTGLASRAIEVCYSVAITYCSWGGKHHVAGAACMAANDDRTYNVSRQYCTWFDTGSGIESIPGSGGSGGGGGGKGSQGDDIDTSPTLENGPLFKFKMYARDYLNSDQRQYLYYQNDNYRNKLLIYLERNGFFQ